MKKLLMLISSICFYIAVTGATAHASAYNFNGTWVDVEDWAGSGENETILVIDWNCLDTGVDTISESHAFGFRWDGIAYELDMLLALDDAGILTVTQGSFANGWLDNIGYYGDEDNETHLHIETGSWNLASTSDPYAVWGTYGDSEWDMNTGLMDTELLVDGQYEGINAIMFYGSLPEYANDQLDIPFASAVPIPGAVWLLGSGLFGLFGLRRKSVDN